VCYVIPSTDKLIHKVEVVALVRKVYRNSERGFLIISGKCDYQGLAIYPVNMSKSHPKLCYTSSLKRIFFCLYGFVIIVTVKTVQLPKLFVCFYLFVKLNCDNFHSIFRF